MHIAPHLDLSAAHTHNDQNSISPGISPARSTGVHRPDEDLEQIPVHAAAGFRGLDVHKEIHLFTSYLFQVTLEGIHSRLVTSTASRGKLFHRLTHNSSRKEVQCGITTTMRLLQLPTMTMGAATVSKLEIRVQWNSRDASYHLEQFNQICSVSSLLQWHNYTGPAKQTGRGGQPNGVTDASQMTCLRETGPVHRTQSQDNIIRRLIRRFTVYASSSRERR